MSVRHAEISKSAAQPIISYLKESCQDLIFDKTKFGVVEMAVLKFQNKFQGKYHEQVSELANEIASFAVVEFVAGEKDKKGNVSY